MKPAKAVLLALVLSLFISACASAPKTPKKLARKPPPTPAELTALKHYKLGIDSYANDQYAEAISHWKITLANDPTNVNAADYIARAENFLKVVKNSKAKKPKAGSATPVSAAATTP